MELWVLQMKTYIDKLEKILVSPRLNAGSRDFIQSLLNQAKTRNNLSDKQKEFVEKYWNICFPPQEILEKENEWKNNFTDQMKEETKIMAEYYQCMYPASKFAKYSKADPNFIPDQELYQRAVSQDWCKKIIEKFRKKPDFDIGEMVIFRQTQKNKYKYGKTVVENASLLILSQEKAAKNGFQQFYSVVDAENMQDQKTMMINENDLKLSREKKDG